MKNIKAEQKIIGAIFKKPDLIHATTLDANDFYLDKHRLIFQLMRKLQSEGKQVDEIGVLDNLTVLDNDIDPFYITSFSENVVSTLNFQEWCNIVKEKSNIRKINFITYDIQKQIEAGKSVSELKSLALEEIEKVQSGRESNIKSLNEIKNELIDLELDIIDGKKSFSKTGYELIDLKKGGLDNDYVLIAASPSVGKTTFAINWAVEMANNGLKVGFIPLEGRSINLCRRIIKQKIEGFRFKDRDYVEGLRDYDLGNNFFIDDSFADSLDGILDSMRLMVSKYGCTEIFLDYLQLVEGDGKESRNIDIGKISRSFVRFKKNYGVNIIALSQLSRIKDREPELYDLRDSGSLEQDADIVIMLHCPPLEKEQTIRNVKVSIKKYREGALDSADMKFHTDRSYFEEMKKSFRTEF